MKNFSSREPVILLRAHPLASYDDCEAEAKQAAIQARCSVIFVHGGQPRMWVYSDATGATGPVSQEIH